MQVSTWAVAAQHPRLYQRRWDRSLIKDTRVSTWLFTPWTRDQNLYSPLNKRDDHIEYNSTQQAIKGMQAFFFSVRPGQKDVSASKEAQVSHSVGINKLQWHHF